MPSSYPPEFRRKVLDLLKAGRSVAQIASDLQISEQSIYLWRKRDRIDAGRLDVPRAGRVRRSTTPDSKAGSGARDPPTCRRDAQDGGAPKSRFAAIKVMAAEQLPVQSAYNILGVSDAGYYAWLKRSLGSRCAPPLADRGDHRSPCGRPRRLRLASRPR
jgi:putative transposase